MPEKLPEDKVASNVGNIIKPNSASFKGSYLAAYKSIANNGRSLKITRLMVVSLLLLVIAPPIIIMIGFLTFPIQTAEFFKFQNTAKLPLSQNLNDNVLASYVSAVLEPQAVAAVRVLRLVSPGTVFGVVLPSEGIPDFPETGTTGTQGETGLQGPAGQDGAIGATGAPGSAGSIGTLTTGSGLTGSVSPGNLTLNLDANILNIAGGKRFTANNTITFGGTDDTSFILPSSSDTLVGLSSTDTLTNKTIAAGLNTISGLTNTNLSGTAGITNANLANSNITTTGNSGSGSVSLGGGLTFTGSGITDIAASGDTLTITSTEADTLTSVTGRGALTSTALTLNGGITTTTSTALTLDSGTTGGVSIGTGANAKTITIGNTTGATALNLNSGTGNINFTVDGTGSSGRVQIGNSGSATPDLLVLDNGTADPTGVAGGMYYNTSTTKFRCYQGGAWTDCIGGDRKFMVKGTDQNVPSGTTLTSDTALTFSVGSGETWVFQFNLLVANLSSGIPDWKSAILGATGWTCSYILHGEEPGNASFTQALGTDCDGTPTAVVNDNIPSDAGVPFEVVMQGTITTTSAGSVTLQWAPNTSGSLTVKAGSFGIAQKVGGADLAEIYYTKDPTIMPGDVVSLDSSIAAGIKKSTKAYDSQTLGIISTRPGLLLGDSETNTNDIPVMLALAGRVPVKVSTENGAIFAGDTLTSSSIPGVAMKATKTGTTIGTAITSFEGEGVGKVLAFVKNGSSNGSKIAGLVDSGLELEVGSSSYSQAVLSQLINQKDNVSEIITDTLVAGLEVISPKITAKQVTVNGQISIVDSGGKEIIKLSTEGIEIKGVNIFDSLIAWFAKTSNGILDFFANRLHTKTLCLGEEVNETCITKSHLDQMLLKTEVTTAETNQVSTDSATISPEQTATASADNL